MNWTSEWPTTPGYYWFYGWCWPGWRHERISKLLYVEAKRTSNRIAYVTEGHFLYRAEGAEGVWQPVQAPELPEEDT